MGDNLFQRLEKQGKIAKQKAGIVQIEALLKEAIVDLREAEKISDIAQRATYLLAYMAMLKAGRALLLLKDYIPSDGAQHKTVVELTSEILGVEFVNLTRHFETMRRKRNDITYETGTLLTKSEAKDAFANAILLVEGILKEVKLHNPQLELKFDFDE